MSDVSVLTQKPREKGFCFQEFSLTCLLLGQLNETKQNHPWFNTLKSHCSDHRHPDRQENRYGYNTYSHMKPKVVLPPVTLSDSWTQLWICFALEETGFKELYCYALGRHQLKYKRLRITEDRAKHKLLLCSIDQMGGAMVPALDRDFDHHQVLFQELFLHLVFRICQKVNF